MTTLGVIELVHGDGMAGGGARLHFGELLGYAKIV